MNNNYPGFSERPDPNEPTIAQPPIILPAPEEQQPYFQPRQPSSATQQTRPGGTIHRPQPATPLARLGRLWKSDPAYRILFIAIIVVLLSTLTSAAVLASVFNQPNPKSAQKGGIHTPQAVNTRSANTPTPTPTEIPTPTPTPVPTPTPTAVTDTLTVEFTDIPDQVRISSTARINVHTNQPNVTVFLLITYDNMQSANPQQTQKRETDNDGDATLSWRVPLAPPGTTAQVKAIAQDQQGHQTTSQTVPVTLHW